MKHWFAPRGFLMVIFMMVISTGMWMHASAASSSGDDQRKAFEQYSSKVKPIGFFPYGLDGIFDPGESLRFGLVIKNQADAPAELNIILKCRHFFDKESTKVKVLKTVLSKGEQKRIDIDLPPPAKNGFFTVSAEVFTGKEKAADLQTSCCVLPKFEQERDPFFGIDKCALDIHLFPALYRVGVGTAGLYIGARLFIQNPKRDPQKDAEKHYRFLKPWFDSPFKLIAAIHPDVRRDAVGKERDQNGMLANNEADLDYFEKFMEHFARLADGRIKMYFVQQEFDAVLNLNRESHVGCLANYVLISKRVYRAVKRVNPKNKLAVLGICGGDYFQSIPPFRISRLVLQSLGDCFDYINIDAYAGNYNGTVGREFGLPEQKGFRKLLFDAAALSESFGRPPLVFNAERCFVVSWFDALDSRKNRLAADLTARSLIINKSAPSPYYSIHTASYPQIAFDLRRGNPIANQGYDSGLWKYCLDGTGSVKMVPRSMVAALNTVARELAFASDPHEVILNSTVYSYIFQGCKSNSDRVITLWTIQEKPLQTVLKLPAPAVITDLMSNSINVPKGAYPIHLTTSPVFIKLQCSTAEAQKMISSIKFEQASNLLASVRIKNPREFTLFLSNRARISEKIRVEVGGSQSFERILKPSSETKIDLPCTKNNGVLPVEIKYGKNFTEALHCKVDLDLIPLKKTVAPLRMDGDFSKYAKWTPTILKAPENVYPVEATMPERGHFKYKGADPVAKIYLAWDFAHLYIAVEVKDAIHVQRQTQNTIWYDDSIQFMFNPENTIPRGQHFPKQSFNFGAALTKNGPELYLHAGGSGIPGLRTRIPMNLRREGGHTYYEVAVPWSELEFKPATGTVFGFNLVVFNNDRLENERAAYFFQLSPGLAGSADAALFKNFIFSNEPVL